MAENTKLPVIQFLESTFWNDVQWQGTTFRWHPEGMAPPIMGFVFENRDAAISLFKVWTDLSSNEDPFEELRLTIIEGKLSTSVPGYIVHLCPDPENTMAHATAEDIVIDLQQLGHYCHANKMDYMKDSSMLVRFKEEYNKHKEFLLAPVIRHDDGQFYVEVELGIIKREIHFTTVQDITVKLKAEGLDMDILQQILREQIQSLSQLP